MSDWYFFIQHVFNLSPNYKTALFLTIFLAVVGQILGIIVGALLCSMKISKYKSLKFLSSIYIWFFRGVPELVLLVLLFSGIAAAGLYRFTDFTVAGILISANLQAAIIAIGLREGAYMAEIIRSGVESVRPGQLEAARSLGMTPMKVVTKIIIPQAMRVIVPPFGNEFNVMLKVTSLASVIGVEELFLSTQSYASTNFKIFSLFIGLAINYLILTTIWSVIQSLIEIKLNKYKQGYNQDKSFMEKIKTKLFGSEIDNVRV